MPPDTLPQISLGTAAMAIFALCAGFVLLRGITRMVLATLVLALSAWAGLIVWQHAPGWSVAWFDRSLPWFTNGLPIATFVAVGVVLRLVANLFVRPFGASGGSHRPRSVGGAAVRLVLALFPTSILSLIGIALVHHRGSVAEVKSSSENHPTAEQHSGWDNFLGRMKSDLDAVLPSSWFEKLDPMADPARVALAKLIAGRETPRAAEEIDPATGQPIPRAIVVRDPELQTLAREGKFDTLLRHPRLTEALADPKVRVLLRESNR